MKAQATATSRAREVTEPPAETGDIQEQIRQRAYELFEQRGCQHGFDVEDWLQAEAEVTAKVARKETTEQERTSAS